MKKIKAAEIGFIKIGEEMINLRQFKKVKKYSFGHNESPEGHVYGIEVTPMTPTQKDIENGVDGSYFIATYKEDEEKIFEEDYNEVQKALGSVDK